MFAPLRTSESKTHAVTAQDKPTPFFQAKLTVNTPGDVHEQEADAVADQVMRMKTGDAPILQRTALTPVSSVQRACAACEREHEKEGIQRKETSGGDASGKAAPSVVSDVLSSGGGQPMDGGTRQFMESRFGQDFSQVRIHTNSRAAESASAIQARAYTSGRDVVFGSGEYQPGSENGQRLLAHELVHVGQQGATQVGVLQRDNELPQDAGRVKFVAQGIQNITNFRVLNYNNTPRFFHGNIIPNSWYPTDGFYKRGHIGRYYKIPNGCHVTVIPSNWRNPTTAGLSCHLPSAGWQNIRDHYGTLENWETDP